MSTVHSSRIIETPAAKVWDILADFGGIHRFHPFIKSSPLLSDVPAEGPGATRQCNFHDGNHVVETVTGWVKGRQLEIEVTGGSMPLKAAAAVIDLEPIDSGRTQVTFTMNYTPKWGPIGALMNLMMMRRMFTKILGKALDGLKLHAEKDVLIDTVKDLAA